MLQSRLLTGPLKVQFCEVSGIWASDTWIPTRYLDLQILTLKVPFFKQSASISEADRLGMPDIPIAPKISK